ncbi:MAG: hypothetical protein JXA28_08325 [Bacteroidetes bacterium]|nr:hypothetical protein [Bacteroidota bacterium]
MSTSPLRKLVKAIASVIGLLLGLVGVILLISGFQAYLSNDTTDVIPFEQVLLALGFLGIPASATLLYNAYSSIERGTSRYGLPDSPVHSLSLIILSITSVVLTVAAFVIVATVF